MAHFLEHLVFKGGEKYDDYRKVNETAERMGAVLNAYTSHDLVAFHITCRAEVVGEAIDLLTDFVGRPKVDQEELDRERGVVIQEIARAHDQPSVLAEHADRPRGLRRPPARPPRARPARSTCAASRARRSSPSAGASGRASRGGAFLVGNLEHVPDEPGAGGDASAASRRSSPTAPTSRRRRSTPPTLVEERESNQSHLRISYRPADRPARRRASARRSPSTRRCSAARWARACSTRSASSAGSPTPSTPSTTPSPTCRSCSSRPASSRASASRPTRACARSSTSCAPTARREEEVERARAYAAGRRVLAFENTNAVARYAAAQAVVHRRGHRPRRGDRRARRGDARARSPRSRAGSPRRPSVAVRRAARGGRVRLS